MEDDQVAAPKRRQGSDYYTEPKANALGSASGGNLSSSFHAA
ncbi:hypothetical protein XCR_4175 [Xanthomonas campestris pv. raphani 756C]|nr:hypothetical protein XCR_4175 [Xanthomonas campestris pv. raphani 756C]